MFTLFVLCQCHDGPPVCGWDLHAFAGTATNVFAVLQNIRVMFASELGVSYDVVDRHAVFDVIRKCLCGLCSSFLFKLCVILMFICRQVFCSTCSVPNYE